MNELISTMTFDIDYTKFFHKEHHVGFFNENVGNGWAYHIHVVFGYNGHRIIKKPYYEIQVSIEILDRVYTEKTRVYSNNIIQAFQDACSTSTRFLLKIKKAHNEQ